jgi:3'-phosphoadenosine 5'-phosphosulfate sulfotransferase (PAPS reductase)/FAD synthetase
MAVGIPTHPRQKRVRDAFFPAVIREAMSLGAEVWFSVSGGKDGQAMLEVYNHLVQQQQWPDEASFTAVVHADLKTAEWPQSRPHTQHLSQMAGLSCVIVGRRKGDGDLTARIGERKHLLAGTGKPFWPSPGQRYCTSHQKTNPINARLTQAALPLVISVEGIRAQESEERAAKQPLTVRKAITSTLFAALPPEDALAKWREYYARPSACAWRPRLALTWYPIFDWSLDDVWASGGASQQELDARRELYREGEKLEQRDPERAAILKTDALDGWPFHPCYVFGNDRCSCAICLVYGSPNDIRVGAKHNPALYRLYRSWEKETGITFRKDHSLLEVVQGAVADSPSCHNGCDACCI